MKRWKNLIYIGIILVTLAVVLYNGMRTGDLPASVRAIMGIPPACVAGGVLCVLGAVGMETLSAKSALRALGHEMNFGRLWAICVLGQFYSNITPGASGGQPMQVYQFHRDRVPMGDATAALTIHFHAFQATLLTLDLIFWGVYREFIAAQVGANLPLFILGFLCNAALLAGSLMIAFYQRPIRFLLSRVSPWLRRFHIADPDALHRQLTGLADGYYGAMRNLYRGRGELLRQLMCAMIRILLLMSVMVFIYHGLGLSSVTPGRIVAMGCIQHTSAAYVPMPGASGAQEGVFSLFFSSMLPGSLLLSALLCWRFITYYLTLIVGFAVTTALGMEKGKAESR